LKSGSFSPRTGLNSSRDLSCAVQQDLEERSGRFVTAVLDFIPGTSSSRSFVISTTRFSQTSFAKARADAGPVGVAQAIPMGIVSELPQVSSATGLTISADSAKRVSCRNQLGSGDSAVGTVRLMDGEL
jgi:hypothetical protein